MPPGELSCPCLKTPLRARRTHFSHRAFGDILAGAQKRSCGLPAVNFTLSHRYCICLRPIIKTITKKVPPEAICFRRFGLLPLAPICANAPEKSPGRFYCFAENQVLKFGCNFCIHSVNSPLVQPERFNASATVNTPLATRSQKVSIRPSCLPSLMPSLMPSSRPSL